MVWRDLARSAGAWRHCAPERYLVLDGEKREAKERDSLLSSYMRGGAASARRRDGRGAWRALCGRGNHLSYTEDIVVDLPVRVSERDFVFETTLALGGRRFVLRAYSAEPHVEEEDAGTLHPSYGAALCVELELTNGEGGDGYASAAMATTLAAARAATTTSATRTARTPRVVRRRRRDGEQNLATTPMSSSRR